MTAAILEHINITVKDAKQTAARLLNLFDWQMRWQGPALDGEGYTCHVGNDDFYLAVYSPNKELKPAENKYDRLSGLNHVGLVVEDIDAMEKRIVKQGYKPHLHADYEPGRRFYFNDEDGIEFEIVDYS